MVDRMGIEPTTNRSPVSYTAQKVFRNTYRFRNLRNKCLCMFRNDRTTTYLDHTPSHTEHNLHDSQCHDAFDEVRPVRCGESALWSEASAYHRLCNIRVSYLEYCQNFYKSQAIG